MNPEPSTYTHILEDVHNDKNSWDKDGHEEVTPEWNGIEWHVAKKVSTQKCNSWED